ncbi:MAG: putative aliphatic sulfonates transport permease protein SsuC [Firmicutes bacterium ADurb.Bin182]|nr:MAG: putative aliphatic sulfonates transport permease protein SsuC [Firmicutes bacterium ADurb.Bin182]
MTQVNPEYSLEHIHYLKTIKKKDGLIKLARYLLLISIIILWEVGAGQGWIDPFITSSPSRIIETIADLYSDGKLFTHIGITLLETVVGFLLGTVIGTLAAILLWWSPSLSRILDPYLVVINALPKIALGPILIVWIGASSQSIIAMGLLISLFVTIMTVLSGLKEISDEKQMLMRTMGATKLQILTMVVLPASVPTIISAMKISVGMSWVGVIVGEYLVSKAGLGYLIVYGGQVFQLDLVMASIVILCALAALMYYAVAYVEKRLVLWRG